MMKFLSVTFFIICQLVKCEINREVWVFDTDREARSLSSSTEPMKQPQEPPRGVLVLLKF